MTLEQLLSAVRCPYIVTLNESRGQATLEALRPPEAKLVAATTPADVRGQLAQWVSVRARGDLAEPYSRRDTACLPSLGAVGCYLSHVRIWQEIARSGRPGFVLEDDNAWASCFRSAEAAWKHVEALLPTLVQEDLPWDVCLLGWTPSGSPKLHLKNWKGSGLNLVRGGWHGTNMYLLTPQGARLLLATALPVDMQVDLYMGKLCTRRVIRVLAVPSRLSQPRSEMRLKSTIQKLALGTYLPGQSGAVLVLGSVTAVGAISILKKTWRTLRLQSSQRA